MITRRVAQLADADAPGDRQAARRRDARGALAIDHLAWAATHAEKVLKRRKVPSGLVMANQAANVEYLPLGVVGVIGPWNYPVFTPMGSIAYALAAGNAVVFKPSEYTPGVGEWLARTFLESVGRPVLQVVTGLRRDGRRAVRGRRRQGRVHRLHRHRQEGDGGLRRDAHPGRDRGRRQGRAARRRRRRHRGRGRRRALGRLRQRRPDLHRRRADLRARAGVRRVPRRARGQGQGPARRRRAGLADRPDHDAEPARRHPPAHPGRARPRRPGRGRRRRRRGGAVRAADDPGRRTGGLARRAGGDLRPDGDRRQGARHGRGDRADQRDALRPRRRRCSPRSAAWSSPAGSARG